MATDQPLRLLVLLGDEPLRVWERMAVEAARTVEGVQVISSHTTTPIAATKRSLTGGRLFRMYVAQATGAAAIDGHHGQRTSTGDTDSGTADMILLLAGAEAQGGPTPRYGTWRFVTEEGTSAHVLPPGIASAILRRPVVHFHLVDTAKAELLRTGCFPVDARDPFATADRVLAHAARWPAQVIMDLLRSGSAQVAGRLPEALPVEVPGGFTMLMRQMKALLLGNDRAQRAVDDGAFGDWNIGILHQPIHALLGEHPSTNVRWFPSPGKGRGRLEPFGYLAADGELNVLYRKTDNEAGTSVIARLRPKPDNILKRSRTMLHGGTHHAYPAIVIVDGGPCVMHTDHENGRTEIMRVNDQNDALENATMILPMALVAPTLFQHEGRWWLMGTRDPLPDAALHIFHATTPMGPFVAHPQNPVKCDVRSSRPAGTPFVHNGELWRPALDASDPDAYAVVLNKVTALTPDRFGEEPHQRVEGFTSSSYGRGVRTLCAMGEVTFVDGLRSPVIDASKANGSRGKGSKRKHKQKNNE